MKLRAYEVIHEAKSCNPWDCPWCRIAELEAAESKLERYEKALAAIAEYNAMEHDICHGQRIAREALEGEQDG